MVKKISDTKHELSFATRPHRPAFCFRGRPRRIYVNCMGSFGYKPGFAGGLLRIRKGQTDFDPDFVINYQTAKVQASNGAIDYVGTVRLASDGKVYAMAANFALDPNNTNPYLAKVMFPVVTRSATTQRAEDRRHPLFERPRPWPSANATANSISAAATTRLTASMPTTWKTKKSEAWPSRW